MLKHRGGLSTMYLCKYFTINLMNKFQGILSFVRSTVWKVLFGRSVADSLEKGTEHEDEYMISEKELVVWKTMVNPILRISLTVYKLGALCMQWMQDKVYSIREAAANNPKRFAEEFGPEVPNIKFNVPKLLQSIIPIVDQSVR
ncbi:hypothetical protein Bca4012_051629 [Brassica carinata]